MTTNFSSTKKKNSKLPANASPLCTRVLSRGSATGTPAVPVQAASMGTGAALLFPQVCKHLCGRLHGRGSHTSQRDIPWKRNLKLPPLPANVKKMCNKRLKCFVNWARGKEKQLCLSSPGMSTLLPYLMLMK